MDPWVRRCPQGHASVTIHSDSYRCDACNEIYDGDPFDARQTAFPVDESGTPPADRGEVLEALVRTCNDPTTTWTRAHALTGGSPKQIGRALSDLEDDGLVERYGSRANGFHWRPTDDGVEAVLERKRTAALDRGGRARAQIDVRATGLLTMLVGAAVVGLTVAANGVVLG